MTNKYLLIYCKSTIYPCMEYCCHIWAGSPSCYLELLDKLQKWICIDYGLLVWGSATPSNWRLIKKDLQKTVRKILFNNYNQPTERLFHELKVLDFNKHKFLTIKSFMWQLTMIIFQIQLNLPSTLETENMEKTTSNTIFVIST